MAYYGFNFIILILLAIYVYIILYNVVIIVLVERYRKIWCLEGAKIPSKYPCLILMFNYIVFITLSIVLLKNYVLNENFYFLDFYDFWMLISVIIYSNMFFLISYAYQKTINIKLTGLLLEKRSIFGYKKLEISNRTKLRVWINYYMVSNNKKIIIISRLRYDNSIEVIIKRIEEVSKLRFLK